MCDAKATCTNSIGNYTCNCPAGYTGGKISEGGCVDVNECLTLCDPNANCVNTNGSFTCGACNTGYTGTGATNCTAVCTQACQNGGTCSAPDTCTCMEGFSGNQCEITGSTGSTGTAPSSSTTGSDTNVESSASKYVVSMIVLVLVALIL